MRNIIIILLLLPVGLAFPQSLEDYELAHLPEEQRSSAKLTVAQFEKMTNVASLKLLLAQMEAAADNVSPKEKPSFQFLMQKLCARIQVLESRPHTATIHTDLAKTLPMADVPKSPQAQYELGRKLAQDPSLRSHQTEAKAWFRLAAARGCPEALKALADLSPELSRFEARPDLSDPESANRFAREANDFLAQRFTLVARNTHVLMEFLKLYPGAFRGFISCRPGPETPAIIARVNKYLGSHADNSPLTKLDDQIELMHLCFSVYNDWDVNKREAESLFHQFPKHVSRKLGLDIQRLLDGIQAEWNAIKGDTKRIPGLIKDSKALEEALARSDAREAVTIGRELFLSRHGAGGPVGDLYPFFKDYLDARWPVICDCQRMLAVDTQVKSLFVAISLVVDLIQVEKDDRVGVSFIRLAEPRIEETILDIGRQINKAPVPAWPEEDMRKARQPFSPEQGDYNIRLKWMQGLRQQMTSLAQQVAHLEWPADPKRLEILKSRIEPATWARLEDLMTFRLKAQADFELVDRKIEELKSFQEHPVVTVTIAGIENVIIQDKIGNMVPSYLYTYSYKGMTVEAILYYSPSFISESNKWHSFNPLVKGCSIRIKVDTPKLNTFEYVREGANPVPFDFQIWTCDRRPVPAHPAPIILVRRANGRVETRD